MAHRLPGLQPVLAVDPLAVTRSSPLRMTRWMWEKLRPGKPRFQEAVDPHAGFVRRHRDGLHRGGGGKRRMIGRGFAGLGLHGLRPRRPVP